MHNLFGRLYKYVELQNFSPLENFLTEAFVATLDCMPLHLKTDTLRMLIGERAYLLLKHALVKSETLDFRTQTSIDIDQKIKRPDIVIYFDGKPMVVIEVKINAQIQQHLIEADGNNEEIVSNQLETYGRWIHDQNQNSAWPGAIVLLTAGTHAPEGFLERGGALPTIVTWSDIVDWLRLSVDWSRKDFMHVAMSRELVKFVEEQKIMNNYITSHDIAATMLFMPSHDNLKLSFRTLINAIDKKYPKLRGGRRVHVEFWAEFNSYAGYFYINKNLKTPDTKPYIAVGICTNFGNDYPEDTKNIPATEPFFFVAFEDEWGTKKALKLLAGLPDGWLQIEEGRKLIAARPVSEFNSEANKRIKEVENWSLAMVGKIIRVMPGFDEAPVDRSGNDDEE